GGKSPQNVPTQPSVGVIAAAASSLQVTGLADGPVGAQDVTVTAKDAFGNLATDYRGTVHLSAICLPLGLCTVPPEDVPDVAADHTFTAGDSGSYTFEDGVTLKVPASWRVFATDTVTASITGSADLTTTVGAATHFEVTGLSDGEIAGTLHTFTVTALDAFDNVAT